MSNLDNSLRNLIESRVHGLNDEFTNWNQFLNKAEQMYPCKSSITVISAFNNFFSENCIKDLEVQRNFIIKMMDIYGLNYIADLYGPNPLEDCSTKNITICSKTIELVQSYVEAFDSLNNDKTRLLLKALQQDLDFMSVVNKYLSDYFVKGRYVVNADIHKKELIDICLIYQPVKTKVYDSLERLWAIVYQKKPTKDGGHFKAANSKAKEIKSNSFVLVSTVERYSD